MNNEALISAHPIDPAMRVQILECLQRLEVAHDVKVLLACESGSRGWGFASPDTDYDVRFIYVNRLAWYLTAGPRWVGIHDFIESELAAAGAQSVTDASRPETSMLDAFLYQTVRKNGRDKNGTA